MKSPTHESDKQQTQHSRGHTSVCLAVQEDLAESQSTAISDLADVDRSVELLMWIASSIRWPWQVGAAGGHVLMPVRNENLC